MPWSSKQCPSCRLSLLKACMHCFSLSQTPTCGCHLFLFGLMTQIIFGQKYKSWNSSLCYFLPLISSCLCFRIFVSFPIVWNFPHFQTIFYLYLWKILSCILFTGVIFLSFYSRQTYFLKLRNILCFLNGMFVFTQWINKFNSTQASVSHPISVHPGLLSLL